MSLTPDAWRFDPLKQNWLTTLMGGKSKPGNQVSPKQPQKKPFFEREGMFGLDKGTLMMGGLGLLAGDRRTGPQMMLQSLSHGMNAQSERRKEAERQAKLDKFKAGLTPEQAMLFDVAPNAVAGGMAEQMFAKAPERKIIEGADGYQYYADNRERVLPDVQAPAPKPDWQETTIQTENGPVRKVYDANAADPMSTLRDVGPAPKKTPLVEVTNNPNQLPNKKNLSPLQLKMDEKYADLLVSWNIGGQGDTVKQIDQLNQVLSVLESGQDVTGFVSGNMPDWLLAGLNPQAMDTKELVQEVVQRSLRETLGAQFTEREGEMLLARAYNPRLDEKQNAQRVRRLIQMINSRAEQLNSLNSYMQANATSAGWDGTLKSANEILSELDGLQQGTTQKRKRWNATTGQMEDVG
tara:strand:- start:1656 stop:2879 length:1224 start_codon:yes stop_codon:yes gene_type:complete